MTTAIDRAAAPLVRAAPFAVQPGRGELLDEAVAVVAMIVVPLDVPAFEPVRVPVTLLILLVAALRWEAVWRTVRANAFAFVLPGLCLLSAVWAEDPGPAIRHGVLLGLAMGIAASMAGRLDRRQFVAALLVSQALLAAVSLGDAASGGIFPHKNVLGQRMMLLSLACQSVLLTPGYRRGLKAVAGAVLPAALLLLAQSGSATAILLVIGASLVLLFARFVWQPASGRAETRALVVSALAIGLPLGLLILEVVFRAEPFADLLAAFGKDATLTGRTDIWALAGESVADHPLLGVGAGNFWTFDSWSAVRITSRMGVANVEAFNFHNAYYEVLVHLGVVGLAAALYVWGRGFAAILSAWWREAGRADPFWIALVAALLVRSLTESELFRPTLPGTLLFWFAVFSARAVIAAGATRTRPSPGRA